MPFLLSVKDTYRQAVEAATGGRNTVMYDDKGNPSVMVWVPRFNLADVIDGAPNTPHPAFIVDGVVKDGIWISKYQNVIHDGRAYSLPGQAVAHSINWDNSKAACELKGPGWHMMTNAEWAAIALWSKKNGTMPRGNNNYGRDHAAAHETAITDTKDGDGRTLKTLSGTGPATWSHDHTPAGIFDLNGNVIEWVDGLRIEEGQIYVHKDNNFRTPKDDLAQWIATGAFFDVEGGGMVLNNRRVTEMTAGMGRTIETMKGAAGYTVPELIKYHALAPADAESHGGDYIYADNRGSRFVYRGGFYTSGSSAGVFFADGFLPRSYVSSNIGFRSAYVD
ncbi:SUMF1/EgtB/PvdO family nonheme iron enzyme [Sporosarcina sp. ITBMC105]